jgi:hypothetical protein
MMGSVLYLLIGLIPGVLFLASLVTTSRWRLSTGRSLVIVVLSLLAALAALIVGNRLYMASDRSGDASAITAAFLLSAFVFAPLGGLVFYWIAIAFSVATRRLR